MAYGDILNRHGDVFGEPVNIASRLCGSARPGTILVNAELSDLLEADERFRVRSIPTLSVRGYRRLKGVGGGAAQVRPGALTTPLRDHRPW